MRPGIGQPKRLTGAPPIAGDGLQPIAAGRRGVGFDEAGIGGKIGGFINPVHVLEAFAEGEKQADGAQDGDENNPFERAGCGAVFASAAWKDGAHVRFSDD